MKNSKEAETMTLIGCDTGFFVELLSGNDKAVTVWKELIGGTEDKAFVSSLTLFELERLALRGKIKKEACDVLIQAIEGIGVKLRTLTYYFKRDSDYFQVL